MLCVLTAVLLTLMMKTKRMEDFMLREENLDYTDYDKRRKRRNRSYDNPKPIEEAAVIEEPKTEEPPKNNKKIIGVVNCRNLLNVRSERTKASNVITTIKDGAEVYLENHNPTNGWYKIKTFYGDEGYVMKDFIKVK